MPETKSPTPVEPTPSPMKKPSLTDMAKGAAVLGLAIGAIGVGCPTNDPQPAYGIPFDDDDSAMDDDDAADDDDDSAMGG